MAWLQQATGLSFLFPVQIKAVIITLQWICRRLTVCFIICHHVAWPVDSMSKRLRDDAKQCKIVLLRYTKALDNDNVIKCN